MSDEVHSWIGEVVAAVVDEYAVGDDNWDLEGLVAAMEQLYQTEITVEELREEVGLDRDALVDEFTEDALDEYKAKEEELEGLDPGLMRNLERYVILQVVDQRWREHLENMEYLREGIHLRAMAQKDPLTEYRSEGHAMFEALGRAIREEVVTILFHAQVEPEDASALAEQPTTAGAGNLSYQHETVAGADAMSGPGASTSTGFPSNGGGSSQTPVVNSDEDNIGRNDPCWCGSGKKFK
jgi:preprotein translocase subunit SecA